MEIEVIAHIGIPLLSGLLVILLVAAADEKPISWFSCNDIGLDLSILSIGANGGIFVNPTIIKHWGEATRVYGIVVVPSDLFLAGVLVYKRRWRKSPVTVWQGLTDLFFGSLAVLITTRVLYLGLKG